MHEYACTMLVIDSPSFTVLQYVARSTERPPELPIVYLII